MNARLAKAKELVRYVYAEHNHDSPESIADALFQALILLGEVDEVQEPTHFLESTRERMLRVLGPEAHLLELPVPE